MTVVTAPKLSFGQKARKFLWSIAAALSTPEAIKAEKYLAVVGLTRAAILIPAAAGIIYALVHVLGG